MMVVAVALVLVGLVVAVILVGITFRDRAFCPRRETLVDIVGGCCQYRASTCIDAPAGCERECIAIDRFVARAS